MMFIFGLLLGMITGVEYAMSCGYCNQGTLTLLVNADGTPKVYEGERNDKAD